MHDNIVPVLTNPVNYTNPATGIAALIGAGAVVAANYIKRKWFSGNGDQK